MSPAARVGPRAGCAESLFPQAEASPSSAPPSGSTPVLTGSEPSTPRSCQQTPLGTLSPRVRPCPLDTRCAPHLPPPLQRAEPVPHSWGDVCSPLSNLVSPRPKGSASCHRGATEVHQPADRHDSAGEERTDCSKYHASPMCQEPSWTSDRHYLTESSQEHREAGPSSPARWGGQ